MATQQTATDRAVTRLAETAKAAGLPADALKRFLAGGYVPQPKQMAFHAAARECDRPDGPTEIGFGGARGPGKSHASLAQLGLDDCQREAGLKCLYLRKVGKSARESFEDLRRKVLMSVPHEYKRNEGLLVFPNDSRIILGHFKDEKDIDNYLGLEYDVIATEETTQLTAKKYRDIRTCNRTSKQNWRPRTYNTTNPGGIGHADYKRKFIDPWRKGQETGTRFIPATVRDNTFVNAEYIKTLEELVGWQRAAWLDGDWDIAAGQYFTNWRYEKIVYKSFEIPSHWTVWAAMDYGFTHPTAVYLLAKNDGMTYVVDEYVAAKRLPARHSGEIIAMLGRNGVSLDRLEGFPAGEDAFSKKGDEHGKTIADQYAQYGIKLDHANMDRVGRAGELLNLLGDPDGDEAAGIAPIEPRIQIFSKCVRLIECIPSLQHNPHRPEDVLKVDVDDDGNGGDDPYDGLGYGLMFTAAAQPDVY